MENKINLRMDIRFLFKYLMVTGCLCKIILAAWPIPLPPGFVPPGAGPLWPPLLRHGPPVPLPFGPRHPAHPPPHNPPPLGFPASALANLGSFAPIGFEYPTEEEFYAMEREKRRQQRIKAEKTRAVISAIKRNQEEQRATTSTTPESSRIMSSKDKDIQMDSYHPSTTESTYDNNFTRDPNKYDSDASSYKKLNENTFVKFDDGIKTSSSTKTHQGTPSSSSSSSTDSSEDTVKGSQTMTGGSSSETPAGSQRGSLMPPDPQKRPVDVKRKKLSSPNGAVTYITEMIYDVEGGNPFKPTTTPSLLPPSFLLPPSNDAMFAPTDDPRLSRGGPSSSSYTTYLPPGSAARPDDDWPIQLPTPPIPFKSSKPFEERLSSSSHGFTRQNSRLSGNSQGRSVGGGGSQSSSSSSSKNSSPHHYSSSGNSPSSNRRQYDHKNSHHHNQNQTPGGLGAAAIAGIVIGSLVSVALLAGTALFVMYKSPFGNNRRGRNGDQPHHPHQHHHPPHNHPPHHGSSSSTASSFSVSRPGMSQVPVRQIVNRSSYLESGSSSNHSNPQPPDVRVCSWL